MSGRHRRAQPNDMLPDPLRGGVRHGTKEAVRIIGGRWEARPTRLNESGRLEWVYLPDAHRGAHDATPTIAEIARDEPCEKTTRWPEQSCADFPLRVIADDWSSAYCLPCRVRAALDRQEHRPRVDPFLPWPTAAVDLIVDWIVSNRPGHGSSARIDVLNRPDPWESHPIVQYRVFYDRDERMVGEFEEWLPRDVARRAQYIATGVWA